MTTDEENSPRFLLQEGDTWRPTGDWTVHNLAAIEQETEQAKPAQPARVDASGLTMLDPSGAWLLLNLLEKPEAALWQGVSEDHASVFEIVRSAEVPQYQPRRKALWAAAAISGLGEKTVQLWKDTVDFIAFTGEVGVKLVQATFHPKGWRLAAIARHVEEAGIRAIPIVALVAFLISIVLAYQSIVQLRQYGGEIFTVNLIALSVLREMGVLLTAIMVAGRSGSAFTAEIGVMQVNEEVDALRVMKLDPFEMLVLPRLVALMIALPLLTFIADCTGLLGGAVLICNLLDISWQQYITQLKIAAKFNHFLVGMIKAPFFAFAIACVGCRRGLQVKGSAESVGRLTTVAVVESIFLVLLIDALFSIFFSRINM